MEVDSWRAQSEETSLVVSITGSREVTKLYVGWLGNAVYENARREIDILSTVSTVCKKQGMKNKYS